MKNLIKVTMFLTVLVCQAQDKWVLQSDYLTIPDTVLVFKPNNFNSVKKYPLVYLLHGYSENYKQWAEIVDLQALSNQYQMILVTPDGFTSYYVNSRSDGASQYENFFFEELVPKIHAAYVIDEKNIFVSGLSMGGYGALRYLLTHPEYFNTAGSTSGALNIDYQTLLHASHTFWKDSRMTDDIAKTIGNPKTTDWNRYSIATLLLKHEEHRKPFLIDCGTEDILYPDTRAIQLLSAQLDLPVTMISQPGGHNPVYWKKSIAHHFVYFQQHLKPQD